MGGNYRSPSTRYFSFSRGFRVPSTCIFHVLDHLCILLLESISGLVVVSNIQEEDTERRKQTSRILDSIAIQARRKSTVGFISITILPNIETSSLFSESISKR